MKKIKIAHIITRLILGGAQENTLLSVEGLMKNPAYEVDLITGPALGPEGSLLERASAHKVNIILVPELRRNINPWYDVVAFFKLLVLLRKQCYDIVHTHSSKAGIVCRIAAALAGVSIIVHTIHGLPFHEHEKPLLNWIFIALERWCARFTAMIVTVCPEMTRKALAVRIGKAEQFVSIYSGIDVRCYQDIPQVKNELLRDKLGIPREALVVGKISRLFHLKGHEYLLAAAKMVLARHPDTYFLLVGDGDLHEDLEELARTLGIRDRIIFAGLIPPDQVPFYINIMDIVAHLSLREGLPRVVPQAFLLEKPVVVFNVDGARDIVENGVNGFLIEPKTIGPIYEKLCFLLEHAEARLVMGRQGRTKVLTQFPCERMVEELHQLYQRLLAQRSVIDGTVRC